MAETHKLQRGWTLWYDSPSTYNTVDWSMSLIPIMTVHSVEEFFVMMKYMKPLEELRTSSQYHFFQDGVKPMWEDPANKTGGKLWVNMVFDAAPNASGNNSNTTSNNTSTNHHNANSNGNTNNTNSSTTGSDAILGLGKDDLDKAWSNILMAIVGEYLEGASDASGSPAGNASIITGVVLSKRKYNNRLAVWINDATATDKIEALKKAIIRETNLPPSASLMFTKHEK